MKQKLLAALTYDPKTGVFTWRESAGRVKQGSRAGTLTKKGYRQICFQGQIFYEHRLAWLFTAGEWPALHVDHIDGNRQHNAISNLRLATNTQNGQNVREARSTNHSGLLGAHLSRGRWRAIIGVNGQYKHLGVFDTKEEAHQAYLAAKRQLHEFNTL